MGFSGNLKRSREEEQGASQRRARRPAPTPADAQPTVLPLEVAIQFMVALKRRFAGEPGKYEEFLAVLLGYRCGSFGVDGIINQMQPLLHGHPDLIRSFNTFLPRGYELKDEQGSDADA